MTCSDMLVIYVLMCLLTYVGADASRSENIARAASLGQTVLLPCLLPATNKHWLYHRDTRIRYDYPDQDYDSVTHNGVIASRYTGRFQLDAQGLLIRDVQTRDQGTYACTNQHQTRRIRLFVPCKSTFYSFFSVDINNSTYSLRELHIT